MPNMFGGDQNHPAYDPRRKLEKYEAMNGDTLYTLRIDGQVDVEEVDGHHYVINLENAPANVRRKFSK